MSTTPVSAFRGIAVLMVLALLVALAGCSGDGATPAARPCHQHPIPPGSECLP